MNVKAKVSAAGGVETKPGWDGNSNIPDNLLLLGDEFPQLTLSPRSIRESCTRIIISDPLILQERSIKLNSRIILGILTLWQLFPKEIN